MKPYIILFLIIFFSGNYLSGQSDKKLIEENEPVPQSSLSKEESQILPEEGEEENSSFYLPAGKPIIDPACEFSTLTPIRNDAMEDGDSETNSEQYFDEMSYDFEANSKINQDDSFIITELEPDFSEFIPEKLIITESVSSGEEMAFAQNLEIGNDVSGNETNVSYLAATSILCGDGFHVKNGHTVLKIVEPKVLNETQNSSSYASKADGNNLTETKWEKEISVYPNPTSSEVHIAFPSALSGNLQLLDFAGKSVHQSDFKDEKSIQMDLESLKVSKGIYILMIETDSNEYSKKIIFQ